MENTPNLYKSVEDVLDFLQEESFSALPANKLDMLVDMIPAMEQKTALSC